MVGHQAVGPYLDAYPPRRVSKKIEVERIVAILKEGALAPVAPLRDVVWNAGQGEAGEPRRFSIVRPDLRQLRGFCAYHRIPAITVTVIQLI